jgi:hypothetical protein
VRCALWTLAVCLLALPASAQEPPIDRFELAVGGRWFGPIPMESSSANLSTSGGGTLALFVTDTELSAAPAIEGRFGVRLSRRVHIEGLVSIAFADLVTRISDDFEDVDEIEVSESIHQMTFGGALVGEIDGWRMGRAVPFVTIGAAYLRQLHEGRPIVEDGQLYHAGGGLNVSLGSGTGWTGRRTAVGLRIDARADLRTGGIAFDDETDRGVAAGLLVFFRF